MQMNQNLLTGLAVALAMTAAGMANAETDDGLSFEDKLAACAACHGEDGDKALAPDYPILAGQYADYLEAALNAYKSGRRTHPIMQMQVEALALTNEDIVRLAAHFASKPGLKSLAE